MPRTKTLRGKAKQNKRRTKESGRARGKPPEYEAARTARSVKREHEPRKDTIHAMLQIFPGGWCYKEETAQAQNTAEKGYYIYESLTVQIAPEDACELYVHHNYDNQRNLDESHCRKLAANMCVAPDVSLAMGPAGKLLIVNGQHTMWAIYLRGFTTQTSIKIWMCRDDAAMASLYAIFDDNKKRSLLNAIHAAQGANALTYEGKDGRLAKWSMCVGIAEHDFSRKGASKEGRSAQVERAKRADVQEFARWMDSHVLDTFQGKLSCQGIGAAFFAMWKSDLSNADRFARQYFTGENLKAGSPALGMRNKLSNRSHGQPAATVCREDAEIMFTAWRKFCLGEPLWQLRRTIALPDPEQWKIYQSANKTMRITLGEGEGSEISVPRQTV